MKFIITLQDRRQIKVEAQYPMIYTQEVVYVDRETRERIIFLNLFNNGSLVSKTRVDAIESVEAYDEAQAPPTLLPQADQNP